MSGVDFETVREIVCALPGVEEGTSYGTPAFRVRKRFFVRLRDDGEVIVVKLASDEEREALMAAKPATFFTTDHYRGHPMLLVRLAKVRKGELAELLQRAWRELAGKRLRAEFDSAP